MSFSFRFMGTAAGVKKAITDYAERLTGVSRQEVDDITPHIFGVIDQNVPSEGTKGMVDVDANGHASFDATTGKKLYGAASVTVKPINGLLVE